MRALWTIYHQEIPSFLRQFIDTPPLTRLQSVGMNCGCEYTCFPRFRGIGAYSRFDHSLGTALIAWHFTDRRAQALAGLFHDVTTPVFAHTVDFLNGDHLLQESTQAGGTACLEASQEVGWLLDRYGLSAEEVAQCRRYPLVDNKAPALSADRLEYTLGNLLNFGLADLEQLRAFYEDLAAGEDEEGRAELVFQTGDVAAAFARAALETSRVYVSDENRFAMETLAGILRLAMERGVLCEADLQTTEPQVIEQLMLDPVCGPAWRQFRGSARILRQAEAPQGEGWVQVDVKRRWIDPMVPGLGRVSQWDEAFRRELEAFQALDFSCWLRAE